MKNGHWSCRVAEELIRCRESGNRPGGFNVRQESRLLMYGIMRVQIPPRALICRCVMIPGNAWRVPGIFYR